MNFATSRKIALKRDENKCVRCNTVERLHVHHKDRDRSNNDPSNLETLCISCHTREHSKKYTGSFTKSLEPLIEALYRQGLGPTEIQNELSHILNNKVIKTVIARLQQKDVTIGPDHNHNAFRYFSRQNEIKDECYTKLNELRSDLYRNLGVDN